MGYTFAQKILASYAGKKSVEVGEIVTVRPDHLLTHDNTAPIMVKISEDLEKYGVCSGDLNLIVLDHVIPAVNEKTALQHLNVREFVAKYGIKNFYDVGVGICHQVVVEKGHARPGRLLVGSDSHTCSYGAVNAFSTGVDRTEAASLTLTGETWMKVPETIKITLKGRFKPGVTVKDLVLQIIGDMGADGADYKAVEYHGDIASLSIDDRIAVSNMGVEMGAKIAVFPSDDLLRKYLEGTVTGDYKEVWADEDASYLDERIYDLGSLKPKLSGPHKVDRVGDVEEFKGMKFHQGLIGTCTNGRYSDLEEAAKIVDGKKIHPDVRLLVLPASRAEFERALDSGVISKLSKAGAVILPPGCGPCLGAHQGILAPGEVCISTANRNFKGRMGCKEAEIYLASAATVALSAVEGSVQSPEGRI